MPTVTRAAIRCFGRSCKVAVPDRAARRVVARVPCKSNLQALVSQGFRLERREPFCMRIPLQASLRDASSPRGGAFQQLPVSCNRALPSGELARMRLRGFSFFFILPPLPASGRTAFPRGTAAAAAKRGHRPLPPDPRAFVPARCRTGVPCPSPAPAQS